MWNEAQWNKNGWNCFLNSLQIAKCKSQIKLAIAPTIRDFELL